MTKAPARIASVVYTRPDGSILMRRRYYVPEGFNTWALHQKFQAPEGCGVQVVVEGHAKPEHGWSDRLVPLQHAARNVAPGPKPEPEVAPSVVEPRRRGRPRKARP